MGFREKLQETAEIIAFTATVLWNHVWDYPAVGESGAELGAKDLKLSNHMTELFGWKWGCNGVYKSFLMVYWLQIHQEERRFDMIQVVIPSSFIWDDHIIDSYISMLPAKVKWLDWNVYVKAVMEMLQ